MTSSDDELSGGLGGAKICVERGYDGIIVSNHGGRSMDDGPSTLEPGR